MLQEHILELLRCPRTGQKLRLAFPGEILQLRTLQAQTEDWLATQDGGLFYPTRSGIPILLAEEACPLGQ